MKIHHSRETDTNLKTIAVIEVSLETGTICNRNKPDAHVTANNILIYYFTRSLLFSALISPKTFSRIL